MSRQNRSLNHLFNQTSCSMLSFSHFISPGQIAFAEYNEIDQKTKKLVPKKIFDIRNNRFLYTSNNWIAKLAVLDGNFSYTKRSLSGSRSRPEYVDSMKCPIYRQYPVIWTTLKSMDIIEPCDNSETPSEIYYEWNREGRHLHFNDSNYRKELLANASFAIMFSSLKLQYDTTEQFSVFFDDPSKEELRNMFAEEPNLSSYTWYNDLPFCLSTWAELNNEHAKEHIYGFINELKISLENFRIKGKLDSWAGNYIQNDLVNKKVVDLKLYSEGLNSILGVATNALEKVFDQLTKTQQDLAELMELLITKPRFDPYFLFFCTLNIIKLEILFRDFYQPDNNQIINGENEQKPCGICFTESTDNSLYAFSQCGHALYLCASLCSNRLQRCPYRCPGTKIKLFLN